VGGDIQVVHRPCLEDTPEIATVRTRIDAVIYWVLMTSPAPIPLSNALIASCAARQDRLRILLDQHAVNALLISNEKDIRYLTGFVGHDSLLLVTDRNSYIISDARYDEYLDPWRSQSLGEIVMGTRHRLEQSIADIATKQGLTMLGVQAEALTVSRRHTLASALPNLDVIDTAGLVSQLRMRKDEVEIANIEQAISIQLDALAAALQRLQVGMTEMHFCAVLEYEMKLRGSFSPSFDIMVSTGANSSIIHHVTGQSVIQPGTLLLDWGAKVDGYSSDLTRTFAIGAMPEKVREIYNIVLEAQLAAIDACKPGVTCAAVDAVARKIISDAGYGEQFGHGLGHGLGMDTHEPPFFNNLQTDITLEPGMVMTVEPGIYLPGIGGVRIEDDVLITETGSRVLSTWPKTLDEMVLDIPSDSHHAAKQEMCS